VIGTASPGKVAATVAGVVLVLWALNLCAGWYLKRYPQNRGYWLVDHKWTLLDEMRQPVDWLVVGDSSGNQGLVVDAWQDALGGSAVNLCTVGNLTAANDAWVLEAYMDRFEPPDNVLVVHVWDVWQRQVEPVFAAQIPRRWGFWRTAEPPFLPDGRGLAQLFLARFLPLYSDNTSLQKAAYDGLRSPSRFLRRRFGTDPDGYMRMDAANSKRVRRTARDSLRAVARERFRVSAINRSALERIRDLAQHYGFQVYLTHSPLYAGMHENRAFREDYAQAESFLDEVVRGSPNLHHLDEVITFPEDQMQTFDHVTHEAAEVFTRRLAEQVREARNAPR